MSSDMIINRSNYEAYFLDYLEGHLEDNLQAQLHAFLEENPDLAVELEGLQEATLHPDHNEIPKEGLRKKVTPVRGIHEGNIDDRLIASMEGDLSGDKETQLEEFLRVNSAYEYDRKLYRSTVLVPEETITYAGKDRLKRRPGAILPVYWRIALPAAAALVLLFLGWRLLFPPAETILGPQDLAAIHTEHRATVIDPYEIQPIAASELPVLSKSRMVEGDRKARATIIRPTPITLSPRGAEELAVQNLQPILIPRYYLSEAFATVSPEVKKPSSRNLFARVLGGFGKKVKQGHDMLQGNPEKVERNITFWSIADLGLQGYNMLADRDMELEVVRDQQGAPTEYTLSESGRILLSGERNKP